MAKVKLVKRGKPGPAGGPKKWYGLSVSGRPLDVRQMARQATRNTSLTPMEMEAALELFGEYAISQLLQGHTVRLGYLGHLRLTFKSEGVDDIRDYHPSRHVREPRILFTPSKELRERVVKNVTFELGPVAEDGVTYASVADYLKREGDPPESSL
ncbi:MAG: hypothetical protein J6K05_03960 [Bacteroidaceae bacterium]|nr:hypothetical protein [Bacteroidaceae bacterium]